MQAMSWAPNASKSIQNLPPANTPYGKQHLVKLQLLSSGSFWALWDVERQYFVPVPGKEKKISPVPSWQTRHALSRGLNTLANQVMKTAATDAGVAGLGLPECLINCARAIFSSDFATAEEQVDLRKIYYLKAYCYMQSRVYHSELAVILSPAFIKKPTWKPTTFSSNCDRSTPGIYVQIFFC